MTAAIYRGTVRNGTIVLDHGAQLKDGVEVIVTPVAATPGSTKSVLEALDATPPVPSEWVDELEELIAAGRRPQSHPDLFTDEP